MCGAHDRHHSFPDSSYRTDGWKEIIFQGKVALIHNTPKSNRIELMGLSLWYYWGHHEVSHVPDAQYLFVVRFIYNPVHEEWTAFMEPLLQLEDLNWPELGVRISDVILANALIRFCQLTLPTRSSNKFSRGPHQTYVCLFGLFFKKELQEA